MSQAQAGHLNIPVTIFLPRPSHLVFATFLAYKGGFAGTEGSS
jgi:hypothetical protein